jgi:hypothetical protein
MFCAFQGAPKILRLYGRGEAVAPGDQRFNPGYPRMGCTTILVFGVPSVTANKGCLSTRQPIANQGVTAAGVHMAI